VINQGINEWPAIEEEATKCRLIMNEPQYQFGLGWYSRSYIEAFNNGESKKKIFICGITRLNWY